MKFCILGAGNGGRAFAAYLSSINQPVNLHNRSYNRINEIKKRGGIKSKGKIKGFFPIGKVTINLELAVRNTDVILVVTPASAHKDIARKIAPFLAKDQIILLNPGRTFGAIEFSKMIQKELEKIPVFIAETQTLLFTSRQLKKNKVEIFKIKDKVHFAAYPDKHTHFIHDTLNEIFPQLVPSDDYFEMTLRNIGMLLHPTLSLLNAGMMDVGKKFKFYREGATKKTCEVLEYLQMEFNQVFDKLGLKQYNFCKWARKSYGIKEDSIYDSIQNILTYKNIDAPRKLITRYFMEDVPTGLVPIASLAKFLNIETPIIDSVINLSSILCGKNFREVGRTLENLSLENYIANHVGKEISRERLLHEDQEIPA